ncbi:Ada metal-binding domain-containing protein [Acinetobacter rudis]|uniref:Ada metal-binding domain-containing protein n=1 Tax=Acinetobacter rudis TaxID=632955 RepID=A0AAW8JCY6_9GAMM|nr:Ada metal-binding domain-containing protein [Acinetobacter rudis]MDQ8935544.1 Ada metal-binding domain-containing protein [Acinetobacter rudis]MDQ8953304.1 Ada metal-binding domain-containing protein [Acinetobacter rudis]MDQ9017807.1 Ada metal-binding domain-containing protein [Acinetobacter rudis]
MIEHDILTDQEFRLLFRQGKILFAGNQRLGIYGLLHCSSGKRMKRKNRVFFKNETEALSLGYRPCGHCMRHAYRNWKNGSI